MSVFEVHAHGLAVPDFAAEELYGEGVHQVALDGSAERARAECGIEAVGGKLEEGLIADIEGHAAFLKPFGKAGNLDADDLLDLFGAERFKDDDFVKAVDELGAEEVLDFFDDRLLDFRPLSVYEESVTIVMASEIAGHDDDGVLEVHGSSLAIGETAVIQNLEEDIEDFGMGLFDFVEEDDAVGATADGLGELAAFFVAYIAGRRPNEAADAELFAVFAHVDADHGALVVEEEFGQGLYGFGFADPGGAKEEE